MSLPEGVLLSQGSPLLTALQRLARDARCVFFAGLPGTGKSLLIHQLRTSRPRAGGKCICCNGTSRARRSRPAQPAVAIPRIAASAYDFRVPTIDLLPSEDEAAWFNP